MNKPDQQCVAALRWPSDTASLTAWNRIKTMMLQHRVAMRLASRDNVQERCHMRKSADNIARGGDGRCKPFSIVMNPVHRLKDDQAISRFAASRPFPLSHL